MNFCGVWKLKSEWRNKEMLKQVISSLLFFLIVDLCAQDPLRFEQEVSMLTVNDQQIDTTNLILFVGSSSIRLWVDVEETFPKQNILNRGFGGSEMSDLIYYFNKLILPYHPKKIFIYEGDNDINSGKSPDQVMKDFEKLLKLIRENVSITVPVYFISVKPSIARKELLAKCQTFNKSLKAWTKRSKHVYYVDVWNPAFDRKGNILKDIFLQDSLHLNKKGYDIWAKQIRPFVK
jgi:lysophospholipase L1-like esterase